LRQPLITKTRKLESTKKGVKAYKIKNGVVQQRCKVQGARCKAHG